MSIPALNWALDATTKNAGQKLILIILANFADETHKSWPSQKTIAKQACMTDRNVRNALVELEKNGLISRTHRYNADGHRKSDAYFLNVESAPTGKIFRKEKIDLPEKNDRAYRKNFPTDPLIEPPDINNTPHTRARAKKPISDTWKPSGRCYELIEKAEIPKSFADQCIDEFVLYWSESQERRASWDATFLNRVKTEWARANKNPVGATTSTPGRAQPQQHKGRTHEQHSRPLGRGERNARQFADQLKALEQAIAEEAQEELDRGAVDQASCDLRGEVVRFLPKRNSGYS